MGTTGQTFNPVRATQNVKILAAQPARKPIAGKPSPNGSFSTSVYFAKATTVTPIFYG